MAKERTKRSRIVRESCWIETEMNTEAGVIVFPLRTMIQLLRGGKKWRSLTQRLDPVTHEWETWHTSPWTVAGFPCATLSEADLEKIATTIGDTVIDHYKETYPAEYETFLREGPPTEQLPLQG